MHECPQCGRCAESPGRCPADGAGLEEAFPGPRILGGRYLLEHALGRGAMGRVYRAVHRELDRPFAIKVIHPSVADGEFRQRFRREARILGQLRHPNVVEVTDFGLSEEHGDLAYLVMELLDGEDLGRLLAEAGSLPVETVVPILEGIAAGLDYAHDHGIVHRDLKPQNVLLLSPRRLTCPRCHDVGEAPGWYCTACGEALGRARVKLVDFGLSGQEGGDRITRPGMVVGTAYYLSPEAVTGSAPVGPPADLYALGVVAYQCLTGTVPFDGSLPRILSAHVKQTPERPTVRRPGLPPAVDRVVLEALAKDPSRRVRSAGALVNRLAAIRDQSRVRGDERSGRPRRRLLGALAAAVGLLLAVVLLAWTPLRRVEARVGDTAFLLGAPRAPDPRLLLVAIDEASVREDGRPLAERHGEVAGRIREMLEAGAAGVVVNALLPPSWAGERPVVDLLAHSHDRLALAVHPAADGRLVGADVVSPLVAGVLGEEVAELFGCATVEADRDGVLRRLEPSCGEGGPPALAARGAALLGVPMPRPRRRPRIDSRIDWTRIPRISWAELGQRLGGEPDSFVGRLVVVGIELAGSGESYYRIPHPRGVDGIVSGLALQALMIGTAAEGLPIRDLPPGALLLFGPALFLLAFEGLSGRSLGSVLLLAGFAYLSSILLAGVLFVTLGLVFPVVATGVAFAVTTGLSRGLRTPGGLGS